MTKTKPVRAPTLHIGFDEGARKEWLTGFGKRKQARRNRGLAHQALKNRKARLDARKERRDENSQRLSHALGDVSVAAVVDPQATAGPATEVRLTCVCVVHVLPDS
jgi:hypothetical protein